MVQLIINKKDKKSKHKKSENFSPFKALMALRYLWIAKGVSKILPKVGIAKRAQGLSPKELTLATMAQPLVGSNSEQATAQRTSPKTRPATAVQKQLNRFHNNPQNHFEKILPAVAQHLSPTKSSDIMVLDDTPIEKSGKKMKWSGKFFNTAERYYYHGYELVVLALARSRSALPLNFIPKRSQAKKRRPKQTRKSPSKLNLGLRLIKEALAQGLRPRYLVFDSWYFALWFIKRLERLGLCWVTKAKSNRLFSYQGRKIKASRFIEITKGHGQCPMKFIVELPKYGLVSVVVNYRSRRYEVLVTNDLSLDASVIVRIFKKRWKIETLFREAKQHYGLEKFHNRKWAAIIAHFALSLLAHFLVRFFSTFKDKFLMVIDQLLKKTFVRVKKEVNIVFDKWKVAFDEIFNYFKISKELKICLISV